METIRIGVDDRGVALLELARPDKHNAMSSAMIAELTEAAHRLGRDPAVRAVVLAAQGETFCAGGDLGWMREQMAADAATRGREATRLAMMLKAINEIPKFVAGRVQGNAFGGGIGLMAVCDVVIAADTAEFALTETRLGLIPATIGPYVVARIGEPMSRRMMISARRFSATEALGLGLVAAAVAADGLDAAVEREIAPGAAARLGAISRSTAAAPGAMAEVKRLVRRLGPVIDEAAIADSIAALVARWESPESAEGIAAFFERRKPAWAAA